MEIFFIEYSSASFQQRILNKEYSLLNPGHAKILFVLLEGFVFRLPPHLWWTVCFLESVDVFGFLRPFFIHHIYWPMIKEDWRWFDPRMEIVSFWGYFTDWYNQKESRRTSIWWRKPWWSLSHRWWGRVCICTAVHIWSSDFDMTFFWSTAPLNEICSGRRGHLRSAV